MDKFRNWLSPIVFLSNNWISFPGVLLVTTSTVLWLFLLPATWAGEIEHPYLGILSYVILPMVFFSGLALIPVGVWWQRRKGRTPGTVQALNWENPKLRRLVVFTAVATFTNIVIGSQLTYQAVSYMDSTTFCGQACHKVMRPEFSAHQESSHSRVECVKCHIGPGASWFVKSKFSGTWQVIAVTLDLYPRPIPTPVHNLRPARETCETCHWPQKFSGDRVRVLPKYASDEANTATKTVLLMRIGGGRGGIHGAHMGPGVQVRYRTGEKRQVIPWVESSRPGSATEAFTAKDAKAPEIAKLELRVMDCMDCHNRPTHTFESLDRALDNAFADGSLSTDLPFLKKTSAEILQKKFASNEEAMARIPGLLGEFYKKSHAEAASAKGKEIENAGKKLVAIYNRNIFPGMNITWGTYPNNIGHTDFPGCFRCHDGDHASAGGKSIQQDCSTCHQLLAMEEASPKILTDLGISP